MHRNGIHKERNAGTSKKRQNILRLHSEFYKIKIRNRFLAYTKTKSSKLADKI